MSLEIAWQKRLGAGFFGGDGFILQKVTGPGMVWLDLSGELVERDLAPGERLLVHAGHVGVFEPSVSFDIQMVRGFRNILFGGEGLFLATLTGPGHIWLQSMPILNLAEEVARYLPRGGDTGANSTAGGLARAPPSAPRAGCSAACLAAATITTLEAPLGDATQTFGARPASATAQGGGSDVSGETFAAEPDAFLTPTMVLRSYRRHILSTDCRRRFEGECCK